MMTETKNKRRYLGGTLEQSVGGVHLGGAAMDCGLRISDCGLEQSGLHADGVRYGPMGFVALEVVGVPVRRKSAIDDELSWLWAREARLEAVKAELVAARQWREWELICGRLARVYARSEELWRRWREGAGAVANGVCKSLVVVGGGSHGGRRGHGGMMVVDEGVPNVWEEFVYDWADETWVKGGEA